MNPKVPPVLAELAGLLVRNAMPDVAPAERASDLGLSAAILAVAGEMWDRQAHILVEENRAIRALLGQAGGDADLHISALQAENDRLRAALIEAHAADEAAHHLAPGQVMAMPPGQPPQEGLGAPRR